MAVSFDGEALTITLESGVTEVNIQDDLYEPWKSWMLAGNMRFPQAFRTIGGDPLSAIINAGAYFFLQNQLGWRIKPPEEDITVYLTGNLAVEDTTLPAFVPTIGAFTAAILGLQPVTQGVTPNMGSQLEQVTFDSMVAVSIATGLSGTGLAPNGQPIGTRNAPSNNLADAHQIMVNRGLNIFVLLDNCLITNEDLSDGHAFQGDSPFIVLQVQSAADVSNCSMKNLTLLGELDGLNLVERCAFLAVTNVSGFIEKCAFLSTVSLSGDTMIMECYSAVEGDGFPVITVGSNVLKIRDYHGSLGLSGVTGGVHTIEMYGGRLHLDATCTGGTVHLRGEPSMPVNDASTGTTVIVQTATEANWNHGKALTVGKFIGLK